MDQNDQIQGMNLEQRTQALAKPTSLPARIEPVHGYNVRTDILPIKWKNDGSAAREENAEKLNEAARKIIENLAQTYGDYPTNYDKKDGPIKGDGYRAFLRRGGETDFANMTHLGPAHVYTWLRDARHTQEVYINLTTAPILDSPKFNPMFHKRKFNYDHPDEHNTDEALQIVIFEHPERKDLFIYQVHHNVREYKAGKGWERLPSRLFDAGFYYSPEQKLSKFTGLPASGQVVTKGDPNTRNIQRQ